MKTLALGSILVAVLCVSCHEHSKVRVALFFNPSHAFHLEEQAFVAEMEGSVLVDTIMKNSRVDKSLLVDCFDIDKARNVRFKIKINEKDTLLLLNETSECISIFSFYDDHTAVTRRAMTLVQKSQDEGVAFDSGPLFDSIASNRYGDQYDSLGVNIKRDTCRCDGR